MKSTQVKNQLPDQANELEYFQVYQKKKSEFKQNRPRIADLRFADRNQSLEKKKLLAVVATRPLIGLD